uniref:Protein kinase domain-containing protein n=1 Tax=Helicotheca tamesis TaxID=374047 RepID=A0A6U0E7I1_9STRA
MSVPHSRTVIVVLAILVFVQDILLAIFYADKIGTNNDFFNKFLLLGYEESRNDTEMIPIVENKLTLWNQSSPSLAQEAETPQDTVQNLRELTFNDLILGEHISSGSCNIAIEVKLPDWWHQQQKVLQQKNQLPSYFPVDENTDLVVKIAVFPDWGDLEMRALRKLHADKDLAEKHKIMPFTWGAETFDNPFYEGGDGKETPQRELPKQLTKVRMKLVGRKAISALVVPNLDSLGQMYGMGKLKTLEELHRFMRSLFETLEYANSVGVNNFDMTGDNLRVDKNGTAILIDWNRMHVEDEDIYMGAGGSPIIPPEGFFKEVPVVKNDGSGETIMKRVKQTSVGSYDIWSVGIRFANILFQPCYWVYPGSGNKKYSLKEIIRSTGRNTEILVNKEGDKSDLATLVGLDSEEVAQTPFRLPICHGTEMPCKPCSAKSFPVLDSNGTQMRDKALDLLEKMMHIAPQDRPTAKELLEHPFLN